MAGLWQRRYTEWVKPVLPWALFNGMILGTGILMGGAWAYEALSFGGFWAWDPVENASLVPWLIVIAGLHCLVIYRARKSGLAAAFIFVPVAFFLILYSTFLTRSGILGDSSVHSFTDLGLSGQLLIFMAIFGVMAIVSIVYNWRNIPKTEKEESTYSREFWMFIGSLVLSISCIHIVVFTSIPVINKIMQAFNPHGKLIAPPLDVIGTYHTVQIPLAIIIALMSGFAQHLKYKKSHPLLFWKKVGVSAGLAVILSAIYAFIIDLRDVNLLILLTASVFSIICNLEIIIGFLRNKKYAVSGAAVAHIGIALILIGALVSNGKREILSLNTEGINIFKNASAKDKLENKVMYNGLKVYMCKNMEAVYLADSFAGRYVYYKIRYRKYDNEWKELKEEFTVHPTMIYNKNKDEISGPSPDTRHYLTKDIFTAISFAPNKNAPDYQVTYDTAFVIHLKPKQTIKVDSFTVTLRNIEKFENKLPDGKGMAYRVLLTLEVNDGNLTKTVTPALILTNGTISHEDGEIHDFGLGFSYHTVNPDKDEHEIIISKGKRPTPDFITVKAYIFPYINVLWIGSLVMIIGFLMSIWKRRK
ncbi:MAG: cytochrome c biogenesis protein CcsA [Bacteroidetes bacterium]|nr:cytochrome c biogenesis protein CcsA [Bacteroidota bacterium]